MMRTLATSLARLSSRAAPAVTTKSAPLIAIEALGRPEWMPRDYAAFARDGMMRNAIVYRAVRLVAEAAASVPLLVYRGEVELDDHPLARLIARPSGEQRRADLIEAWVGYLMVSGNAYLEAVAIGGEVREIHALRPDRVRVIEDASGWPAGFEYRSAAGPVKITGDVVPGVRRILHTKQFHPLSDLVGLSPIEAAAGAIDIHNAAGRWNKALLDNAARPSGALVYSSGGHLSADQFERLKGELAESFQGARNAGRPLLLEGGLDWKPMSLSPKDMDFLEARNAAAREIALAIGVPPMLLSIPGDNTYSNYQEASRVLWRQTVIPLLTRLAAALGDWLGPAWEDGLRVIPDLDAVDALASDRAALWERIEAASFLTLNEKRSALGYPPLPGGDRI